MYTKHSHELTYGTSPTECTPSLELNQKEEQLQRPEQARGLDPMAVLPSLAEGWGLGGPDLYCDGSFRGGAVPAATARDAQ
jgi:hypothetical protein